MFSFGLDNNHDPIDNDILVEYFRNANIIISAFRQNPRIQDDLYLREEPWTNHPVLIAIYKSNLIQYGPRAVKFFPAWYSDQAPNIWGSNNLTELRVHREAGSLIDISEYLIRIFNVYEPSKSILHNLYSTNITVGVVGQINDLPARVAIKKFVKKILGNNFVDASVYTPNSSYGEQFVNDLILLIKFNIDNQSDLERSRPGIEFERKCAQKLAEAGFNVELTPTTGDFGADIICSKDGISFAIQCKDLIKPAGVKAIQEISSAILHYTVDFGVVCADSGFTNSAIQLASSNKIIVTNLENLPARLDSAC